tara:strand:+ start:476 stop:718 length:243 start_codon:yes stop_codon:yes gene_type:complete
MMKVKNVIGYKDVEFDWDVCDRLYEEGSSLSVGGRFIDVGFWKEVFEMYIDEYGDDKEIVNIKKMLSNIKELDGEVLVEF